MFYRIRRKEKALLGAFLFKRLKKKKNDDNVRVAKGKKKLAVAQG